MNRLASLVLLHFRNFRYVQRIAGPENGDNNATSCYPGNQLFGIDDTAVDASSRGRDARPVGADAAAAELKMPVWTPGSYLDPRVRAARPGLRGKGRCRFALTGARQQEHVGRSIGQGSKEFVASYRVYANELTVRTNELNDEHAFWNNGALLYVPKR